LQRRWSAREDEEAAAPPAPKYVPSYEESAVLSLMLKMGAPGAGTQRIELVDVPRVVRLIYLVGRSMRDGSVVPAAGP
jgi:hypothetical protein